MRKKIKFGLLVLWLAVYSAPRLLTAEGEDAWFHLTLNGAKIGYFYYTEEHSPGNIILIKEETFMKFKRAENILEMYTHSSKTLDRDGKLLQFRYRMNQGETSEIIWGEPDYKNGIINIMYSKNRGGEKVETLKLENTSLTEYRALRDLKKQGLKEGNSIDFKCLMTEKASYLDVKMTVEKIETQTILGQEKVLYKIVRTLENIPGVKSITWMDSQLVPFSGELILPQIIYKLERTTREAALKLSAEYMDMALITLSEIKLNHFPAGMAGISRENVKSSTLLLKLEKGDVFPHDLEGGIQKIISGNLREGLKLSINTTIPVNIDNIPVIAPPQELDQYLESNAFIECDSEKIQIISRKLLVRESARQTALNMQEWVYRNIKMNFKTGLGSALQVLESGEGDCTEHAVLTAALCRSVGIPTRIAMGYNLSIRQEGEATYVGHMWNEVYINGMWLPIDSTSPRLVPDPFRIRFFSSNLDNREIMKKIVLFSLTKNLGIYLLSSI